MSNRIKKIKVKQTDGSFSEYIPIGADAANVDMANGNNLENEMNKKPYYFDNVAAMKSAQYLKAGDCAITLGYYSVNDGGNGEYKIVNDSTLVDDGGSVHNLANGLKAKLIVKDSINPLQFGAKGDGVSDDKNTIQNCLNLGGKIVFPKNKTFMISSVLSLNSNTIIYGNFSEIKKIDNDKFTENISCKNNVVINNLIITGTLNDRDTSPDFDKMISTRKTIQLVSLFNCENVKIENCIIQQNLSEGIKSANSKHIKILNCKFYKTDCCFIAQGSFIEDVTIDNCLMDGHRYSEPISFYIADGEMKDLIITNNIIKNKQNSGGIFIGHETRTTTKPYNIIISHNILSKLSAGINLFFAENGIISENLIEDTGRGIVVSNCKNVKVNNNNLKDIHSDAIQIKGNSQRIEIFENNIDNYNIDDNPGPLSAFRIGSANNTITELNINDNKIFRNTELYTISTNSYIIGNSILKNSKIIDKNESSIKCFRIDSNATLENNEFYSKTENTYETENNKNINLKNILIVDKIHYGESGYNSNGYFAHQAYGTNNKIINIKKSDNRGLTFSKYTKNSDGFIKTVILKAEGSTVKLVQDSEIVEDSIVWKTPNFEKSIPAGQYYSWQMICQNGIWYEL